MHARTVVQDLLLLVLPAGGQRTARRNAWAGMAADAARSRAAREAASAMAELEHRQRGRGTGT